VSVVSKLVLPRLVLACLLSLCFGLFSACLAPRASADDQGATWHFVPAQAPEPPPGASPSQFPVALGGVGDLEFWAPNRGVLITGGTPLVGPGVYAYDGVSWHQLATVCGGAGGRIAWAGPDEFWTISDQRPGQILPSGVNVSLQNLSLCHFLNGQVVGSYAMPVNQQDSYQPMNAAACSSPSNCWFGGGLDTAGAFHLHWNGSEISVVNAPQGHAVGSMALEDGQIYESVQLAPGDEYGSESLTSPALLHTIQAQDPSNVFHDVFPTEGECAGFCPPLPDYGTDASLQPVAPDTLSALALSSDQGASGVGAGAAQLWAVAGADSNPAPAHEGTAHPLALHLKDGEWKQVIPDLVTLEAGVKPAAVAADPGEEAAWIGLAYEDEVAHLDRIESTDSGQTWSVAEQDLLGPEQDVGPRGGAGPIACPAPHECWLATGQGWLFQLSDGSVLPANTDPMFDGGDGVITYRPPDGGVPEVVADQPPADDSLANQLPPVEPASPPAVSSPNTKTKAPVLVSHVHTKLLRRDVLRLTFTLARAAHVQLLATRHGKVVASTRRQTLKRGPHALELPLSPRHWPTKLDLRATLAT
jgi:hypothetical protein